MPVPNASSLALKEWAVAVKALAEGEQILILRKGGIHRADKEFRVVHPEFLLYPTFEHQRIDLLKEGSHDNLEQTLIESDGSSKVKLGYWCEVTDKYEVSDQSSLDSIAPYHIWTTDYANTRLHWRPKQPLTVALLRVYSLQSPQTITVLEEYGGCKSWVELAQSVPLGKMAPVLNDGAYETRAAAIRDRLDTKAFVS